MGKNETDTQDNKYTVGTSKSERNMDETRQLDKESTVSLENENVLKRIRNAAKQTSKQQ